ncbi:MAG: CHRD domain-containing protein [Xanthomonadales bacterium]|nr:CHRD domain-containing protein [Xanthomonadales bacterium]
MTKSIVLIVGFLVLVSPAGLAVAKGSAVVQGALSGYNEVPAISTTGHGAFFARIDSASGVIDYELSYDGTEGEVTQAHIHVAQPGVNGAISVFLCSNLGNGPAGTQPCPSSPGSISGTITGSDVIGPAAQGVQAGAFDELVRAIRAGATYVNVHTTLYPGGEVRAGLAPHH